MPFEHESESLPCNRKNRNGKPEIPGLPCTVIPVRARRCSEEERESADRR